MQSTYTDKQADGIHTVAQAARELGVHADTIRRWANAGKVAYFRTPNGHRRFLESDIAAIKEGTTDAEQTGLPHKTAGAAVSPAVAPVPPV